MPFRVTHSRGPEYKKYGVHHGAKYKLKAWDVSDMDREMLTANDNNIIILQEMPDVLFIEMEKATAETVSRTARQMVPNVARGRLPEFGCRRHHSY